MCSLQLYSRLCCEYNLISCKYNAGHRARSHTWNTNANLYLANCGTVENEKNLHQDVCRLISLNPGLGIYSEDANTDLEDRLYIYSAQVYLILI